MFVDRVDSIDRALIRDSFPSFKIFILFLLNIKIAQNIILDYIDQIRFIQPVQDYTFEYAAYYMDSNLLMPKGITHKL